ncbi:MAG TPA: MFS transporter [Woeseiaceae bacterium]|nr:MFS transporter [Woeseiaceae bacterium]
MTAAGSPGGALSPFRHPVFRKVWIANLGSQFGGLIQIVGASWMMLSIAASAEMVTLVQSSTTLPIVLFALVAGAFADSFDRRRIMLATQVFMLLVSVALAVFTYLGLVTPWLLLLLTFLIGCGAAFNGPAWQASVADMVPREDLPSAVALNSMGFNVARSAGPAIGGLIVAAAGAAAAFAMNAVSYLGIIAVLARWRLPVEERTLPRERLGTAILAGIRYVAMSPNLKSTLLRGLVFGIGASALMALMPLIARDLVGGGSVAYGLLLGSFGAGAVGGALLAHRLRQTRSNEAIVRTAVLAYAFAAAATAFSTVLPLTMFVQVFSGAGWVLALSTFNVTVQTSAPRWVVGRALSLYQMLTFAGMAGGSWVAGVVTGELGISQTLLISSLVLLGCAAMGLRFAQPETAALNLDLLRRWREPEIALEIEQRSGPIVISVEYRIAEENVLEFLAAMGDRRRIRRRDGARHWTLLRDLSEPELWIERFDTPTWLDYIRQSQRATQDDAAVWDRINRLHRGPGKPHVRRLIERQTSSPPGAVTPRARALADPMSDPSRQS